MRLGMIAVLLAVSLQALADQESDFFRALRKAVK